MSRFGPVCHEWVRIPISRGALVPPSSWVASYRRTPPVCVHLAAGGGGRAARTRRVHLSIQRGREKHRVDSESIAVRVLAAVGRWDGLMRGRVRGQRAIVRPTRAGLPHLTAQLARHAGRRGPGCHGHSAARTQSSIRSVVEVQRSRFLSIPSRMYLSVAFRILWLSKLFEGGNGKRAAETGARG